MEMSLSSEEIENGAVEYLKRNKKSIFIYTENGPFRCSKV